MKRNLNLNKFNHLISKIYSKIFLASFDLFQSTFCYIIGVSEYSKQAKYHFK